MTESVVEQLADLRDGPDAGQAVWDLLKELKGRGAKAESDLDALFALGTVPQALDGPTDGILVTTTTNPLLDQPVKAITRMWMPWQGKRFDAASNTGDNRMTGSSRIPSKLLWPRYSMKDAKDGKLAFDFKTYVDEGKDDPGLQVLVIDYADIESNPRLVIRSIRDELVELVPGTYLGKILFRLPSGKYDKIGFFALRSPR